MSNDIITTQQNHLPSTPMPLADFTAQLKLDSERLEQVQRQFSGVTRYRYGGPEEEISALTEALQNFDRFVEGELPIIIRNLELALDQKATSEDIAVAVAVLIHSFPNVKDNFDSTIFSQQVIRFLEEWQIGEGVLGLAFRHIILNHKWLPSISEIRDGVNEAIKTLSLLHKRIYGDPEVSNDCGIWNVRETLKYYLADATKRRND
jgi:hypothetical protein